MVTGCQLSKIKESLEMDQTLYRSIIGSLLYLTASRPYIMQVVSIVRRFQAGPIQNYLLTAKRILRYLRKIMDYGLWYLRAKYFSLIIYTDVDWAGNVDD